MLAPGETVTERRALTRTEVFVIVRETRLSVYLPSPCTAT